MDRAQTSDQSIKQIIVEFPGDVLNSSHSCVPISLWLTSKWVPTFCEPYFSSIFQTMRLSVEEFIAKLSWRDSMLTSKVCRAYTHLSPPKPLSSAYQWERELVGRLE